MKPADIKRFNMIFDLSLELFKSKDEESKTLGTAILTVLSANNEDTEEEYGELISRIFHYAMERAEEQEEQEENINNLLEGTGIIKE